MKKIIFNAILCVMTAIFAVSCAPGVRVTTDYDKSANFANFQSFSLYNYTSTPNVNGLNAKRILTSVSYEMIKKGYTEDVNNPDLMINVVSLLKDKKSIDITNNGMNGPLGFWAGGNASGTIGTSDSKDGSIVIQIMNVKTNMLLWEGIGTAEMTKQPKDLDEAINIAVAKIMNEFPQQGTNALPRGSKK